MASHRRAPPKSSEQRRNRSGVHLGFFGETMAFSHPADKTPPPPPRVTHDRCESQACAVLYVLYRQTIDGICAAADLSFLLFDPSHREVVLTRSISSIFGNTLPTIYYNVYHALALS